MMGNVVRDGVDVLVGYGVNVACSVGIAVFDVSDKGVAGRGVEVCVGVAGAQPVMTISVKSRRRDRLSFFINVYTSICIPLPDS